MNSKIKKLVWLFSLVLITSISSGCEYLLNYEDDYDEQDDSWSDNYDWDGDLYTEISLSGTISFPRITDKEAVRFSLINSGDDVCRDVLAEVFYKKDNFIANEGSISLGSINVNEHRDVYVYLDRKVPYSTSYSLEIKVSWFNNAGDYFEVVNKI